MRFRDILLAAALGASGAVYYYVDSVNGNDANGGKSTDDAFASLSALSGKRATHVGIAKGSVLVANAFAPNNSGMTFFAYGSGADPIFHNSVPHSAASWTNVSGNIYSMDTASTYNGVFIWRDASNGAATEGQVTYLTKGTAGSLTANQWAISGGKLQVNIGSAPASTDIFQVPQNTNNMVVLDGINYTRWTGLNFRFGGADAFLAAPTIATQGLLVDDCELAYCGGSLFHMYDGGATDCWAFNSYFHDQPGSTAAGNSQDAFAFHAASGGGAINCIMRRIAGEGFTSSDASNTLVKNCTFDGAIIRMVNQGVGGGVHDYIGLQFVNEPPNMVANTYMMWTGSDVTSDTVINIYNCSFARGTGATTIRGLRVQAGAVTVRNLAVWGAYGIAILADDIGGNQLATLDADYVAVGGATLDRFKWAAATHDISLAATPYTDISSNDLSPKVGSVLLGAGTAIAGVTTGSPPDIGYTGAAA